MGVEVGEGEEEREEEEEGEEWEERPVIARGQT